jgi:hypothetical protein
MGVRAKVLFFGRQKLGIRCSRVAKSYSLIIHFFAELFLLRSQKIPLK